MNILVSCVPFERGKSGISVYTSNVVRELSGLGHRLTLLVEPGMEEFFPEYPKIALPGWTARPLFSMFYHLFILPFHLLLLRRRFDFCIIAAISRRALAFYPLFTVGVVHDLAWVHIAGKYDLMRTIYLARLLPFFVRRADRVVAISRSTAADCEKYWHIPANKMEVVYNGLSPVPPPSGHDWQPCRQSARQHYLLYISRIEHPGKNHLNLIRAYEQLPDALAEQYPLVLAGADWHGAETVHEYVRNSPRKENIHFTGFLPTEELGTAYAGAAAYVFPSYFEGFGLSLIEAMAAGIPCCCSNNSSLGEIGSGAALLFDPAVPESIAAVLKQILTDQTARTELIAAGKKRAAEFDWKKHAEKLVKIYENRH